MNQLVEEVKSPQRIGFDITGVEKLNLGESFSLFFKEFSLNVDKKMAALKSTIHAVDYKPTKEYIAKNNILFVKNAGVKITTPEYFNGEFQGMEAYVSMLLKGVFVINGLRSETNHLYMWIKSIIKTGRMDKSFKWGVTDYDTAYQEVHSSIKALEPSKRIGFPLDQVYLRFEDCFDLIDQYNNAIKNIKSRDVEVLSKEISAVYNLGSLLVTKIQTGDMLISEQAINDIQNVVNEYIDIVNTCGVVMGLLNELTAVFTTELSEFKKMK